MYECMRRHVCVYAQPFTWILFCFLTKRVDNFIFTFHNTNENCSFLVPLVLSKTPLF